MQWTWTKTFLVLAVINGLAAAANIRSYAANGWGVSLFCAMASCAFMVWMLGMALRAYRR